MINGRRHTAAGHDSGRNYLTGREVERLIEATKGGRNEARDRTVLLIVLAGVLWLVPFVLLRIIPTFRLPTPFVAVGVRG